METLKTVATFGFLANDVEDGIDQLCAFRVMPFRPIVTGATLPEDKIVRSKYLTERARSYRIHRARFQIDQNGSRNVFPAGRFVVINVNTFQLEIGVTVIGSRRIDSMLVGYYLPKLSCDRDIIDRLNL